MSVRKIRTLGDEVLTKKARYVEIIDDRIIRLLDDMNETLKNEPTGIGLAAPQVGVLRRVVVIDMGEGEGPIELINPEIVKTHGREVAVEGCLSVPGRFGEVERPERVTVRARNRKGEEFEITGEGLLARAFCHEIDHLNGELFISRVIKFVDEEDAR